MDFFTYAMTLLHLFHATAQIMIKITLQTPKITTLLLHYGGAFGTSYALV